MLTSFQGRNWSIPYSLGPPHMESDKAGDSAPAFDCCFHPDAIRIGNSNKEFKNLLMQTAANGIEEGYKRQHQQVNIEFPAAFSVDLSYPSFHPSIHPFSRPSLTP